MVRVELPRFVGTFRTERAWRELDFREVRVVNFRAESVVYLVVCLPECHYCCLIVGNTQQFHLLGHGEKVVSAVGAREEGIYVTVYRAQY